MMEEQRYQTLKEFYPYYLTEHLDPVCRALHYTGTTLLLLVVAASIYFGNAKILFLLPVVGYAFAWVGHFVFEKNKPATFKYPLFSLASDFIMSYHFYTGQIDTKIEEAKRIILK